MRLADATLVLTAPLLLTAVTGASLRPTARQLYKLDGTETDASCKNEHTSDAECDLWASKGECDANPGFMRRNCGRSCVSCGWVDSYCSDLVHSAMPAKTGQGAITATFEHALTRTEYGPTVHSSPETTGGPWVMTFSNFLEEGEAEAFISSTAHHFSRSLAGDVVSPVRTSQQAWCQVEPCVSHPLVKRVEARVANLTGVPAPNAEFTQVLRYEHGRAVEEPRGPLVGRSAPPRPIPVAAETLAAAVHPQCATSAVSSRARPPSGAPWKTLSSFTTHRPGQFYKTHHDQNAHADSLMGVRLFTFFIYLQDEGLVGGATHFPNLNITIKPKAGSALLWPNVRDGDLRMADMRTEHEAQPPIEGIKYSANLWLHQYDFRGPNTHGCDLGKHVKRRGRAAGLPPAEGDEEDVDDSESKFEL